MCSNPTKKKGNIIVSMYILLCACFNDVILSLVAEIKAFFDNSISGPPAAPPPAPTFEECILDALTVLNGDDMGLDESLPAPASSKKVLHTCPVPGCGKKVVGLWNHINQ